MKLPGMKSSNAILDEKENKIMINRSSFLTADKPYDRKKEGLKQSVVTTIEPTSQRQTTIPPTT